MGREREGGRFKVYHDLKYQERDSRRGIREVQNFEAFTSFYPSIYSLFPFYPFLRALFPYLFLAMYGRTDGFVHRCTVFGVLECADAFEGCGWYVSPNTLVLPPPGPCTCARILSVCTCEDKLINWLDGPVEVYYFYFCALRKAIECIQHVPVLCIMHSAQCVWHRASTGKYVCT